jgi:hypothetical protein
VVQHLPSKRKAEFNPQYCQKKFVLNYNIPNRSWCWVEEGRAQSRAGVEPGLLGGFIPRKQTWLCHFLLKMYLPDEATVFRPWRGPAGSRGDPQEAPAWLLDCIPVPVPAQAGGHQEGPYLPLTWSRCPEFLSQLDPFDPVFLRDHSSPSGKGKQPQGKPVPPFLLLVTPQVLVTPQSTMEGLLSPLQRGTLHVLHILQGSEAAWVLTKAKPSLTCQSRPEDTSLGWGHLQKRHVVSPLTPSCLWLRHRCVCVCVVFNKIFN